MRRFVGIRSAVPQAVLLAVLLGARGLGAVEVKSAAAKKPVDLKTLTAEQIKALPDNDPIDVGGRITTKAQALADLRKIKPEADAWVVQKTSAAAARFQKLSSDFAALQKSRIESNNIKSLAAVAALRQQVEQQKTDTKPTPCAAPHLASVSSGSGGIYAGMAAFLASPGPARGPGTSLSRVRQRNQSDTQPRAAPVPRTSSAPRLPRSPPSWPSTQARRSGACRR